MKNLIKNNDRKNIIKFINNYCNFKNGDNVYILHLLARKKENEFLSNVISFREIITSEKYIEEKYNKLLSISKNFKSKENPEKNVIFRLYISVNSRNVKKSYYMYQKHLIDLDFNIKNNHEPSIHKMKRLDKEWIKILSKNKNKYTRNFLIDIDDNSINYYKQVNNILKNNTTIITKIKSPNGYHIITKPFSYPNTNITDLEKVEIKTDGLLFITILK